MPAIKGKYRGSDLRKARLGFDASIREVARHAGVSPSTVMRWEGTDFLPLAPTLALRCIAKALRVRLYKKRWPRIGRPHGVPDLVFTFPSACLATTRCGHPCKKRPVEGKMRCRLHGGLSTGPKTEEGRARCRAAAVAAWELRHKTASGSTVVSATKAVSRSESTIAEWLATHSKTDTA